LNWDLLLLLLQLSDVPTLAVLGRVSLDFLVATSPLLYREVEITSMDQLDKLFCVRGENDVSSTPPPLLLVLLSPFANLLPL